MGLINWNTIGTKRREYDPVLESLSDDDKRKYELLGGLLGGGPGGSTLADKNNQEFHKDRAVEIATGGMPGSYTGIKNVGSLFDGPEGRKQYAKDMGRFSSYAVDPTGTLGNAVFGGEAEKSYGRRYDKFAEFGDEEALMNAQNESQNILAARPYNRSQRWGREMLEKGYFPLGPRGIASRNADRITDWNIRTSDLAGKLGLDGVQSRAADRAKWWGAWEPGSVIQEGLPNGLRNLLGR